MSTIVVELYDALRAAGVDEARAKAAAGAVVGEAVQHENRLSAVEGRLTLLTWMVGALAAAVTAVGLPALWLLVRLAAKAGVGF